MNLYELYVCINIYIYILYIYIYIQLWLRLRGPEETPSDAAIFCHHLAAVTHGKQGKRKALNVECRNLTRAAELLIHISHG